MDQQQVFPVILVALFSLPVSLFAATPLPLKGQPPVVVLLPQIEPLPETSKAQEAPAMSSITASRPASRDFFPPIRSFWKRWRTGSEFRPTASVPDQSSAVPPSPQREVVTVSNLRLEPIAEVPVPPQHGTAGLPVIQVPAADSDWQPGIPSAGLIEPEVVPVDTFEGAVCDQPIEGDAPHAVSPRSHKVGSRIRFPHLSSLFR